MDTRPLLGGVFNQTNHLFHGAVVDQGADRHIVVETIPHLQLLHFLKEACGERIHDPILDIDPICADACLTRIAKFGCHQSVYRCIQVSIVKNDERRIAPQFQRKLLDVGRALTHQQATRLSRACERQLAYLLVASQFGADLNG